MTTATNEQHPRLTWQDFPSLHDLDFSPGSDAQATLCDLRILRQEIEEVVVRHGGTYDFGEATMFVPPARKD